MSVASSTRPCAEWGAQARYTEDTWEQPILAQVAALTIDDGLAVKVVAALGSTARPVTLDRGRIQRQMQDLARDHLAERLDDTTYLGRLAQLRAELAALETRQRAAMPAKRALEWLRAISDTWAVPDVSEAKAELLHALYERIVVRGREIVSAHLTPAAYANGMALALPEVVMARPEGIRTPDPVVRSHMLWSAELRARGLGMIQAGRRGPQRTTRRDRCDSSPTRLDQRGAAAASGRAAPAHQAGAGAGAGTAIRCSPVLIGPGRPSR